jgi:hypothetical protein
MLTIAMAAGGGFAPRHAHAATSVNSSAPHASAHHDHDMNTHRHGPMAHDNDCNGDKKDKLAVDGCCCVVGCSVVAVIADAISLFDVSLPPIYDRLSIPAWPTVSAMADDPPPRQF